MWQPTIRSNQNDHLSMKLMYELQIEKKLYFYKFQKLTRLFNFDDILNVFTIAFFIFYLYL